MTRVELIKNLIAVPVRDQHYDRTSMTIRVKAAKGVVAWLRSDSKPATFTTTVQIPEGAEFTPKQLIDTTGIWLLAYLTEWRKTNPGVTLQMDSARESDIYYYDDGHKSWCEHRFALQQAAAGDVPTTWKHEIRVAGITLTYTIACSAQFEPTWVA